MTKTLILIALILLVLYLYWKKQTKPNAPKPEEIIERKGKERSPDDFNQSSEVFFEAEDFSEEE